MPQTRRKAGRPPKSPELVRKLRLTVRLSDEELASVRTKAEIVNLPIATLLRLAALGTPLRPVVPAANLAAVGELNRIGNNVNQLAYLAHQGRIPSHLLPTIVELQALLGTTRAALLGSYDSKPGSR